MLNINKSTFYRHYEFIGELETEIKKEMAHKIFDELVNGAFTSVIDRTYLTRCLNWMNALSKGERKIISSPDEILFDEYSKCCYGYFKEYIKDPVVMLYTICTSYLAIRIFAVPTLGDESKLKFGVAMMKIFVHGFDNYQEEYAKNHPNGLTMEDFELLDPANKDLEEIKDIFLGN
ncbi:MAG: hypothetical protein K5762_01490 [Bacilli bacterium]|nr:hypothetical protein [Bacilli bacterium]